MEILAFTYLAVDYEAPTDKRIQCRVGLPSLPSSAWITVAALTLALSSFGGVPSAIALIRQGDVGNNVTTLQTSLQNLGYSVGSIDGIFGDGTKSAVMRFQQQHGLIVDGIAGSQTLAKLAELENGNQSENAVAASTSASSAGTGGGDAVLTLGDSGAAVSTLQTKLRDLGFFRTDVTISGYYGPITVDAVKAFQRSQSLTIDGIAGPATQSAIAAAQPRVTATITPSAPATATTSTPTTTSNSGTLRQGDSGTAVTTLQFRLQQLNYFTLTPTGYYGPVTTESVMAFQQANGLTIDGIAGPITLTKLNEVNTTADDTAIQPSEEESAVEPERVTEQPPSPDSAISEPATVVEVADQVEETTSTPTNGNVVKVQATNGLRIRTAPNKDAAIAGLLLDGTSVQVTGEQVGAWLEIKPSGWIHQDYVIR